MLGVLAVGEGAARVFRLDQNRHAVNDPVLGWTGAEGAVVRWGREGWGVNRYRETGELQTARGEGRPIVVLGDSHTEAFQVNGNDNFVSVAENILWSKGLRWDLRNFGRSAFSMTDYVRVTRYLRRTLHPAAIVVQLEACDFDAMEPGEAITGADAEPTRPKRLRSAAPRRSHLYNAVRARIMRLRENRAGGQEKPACGSLPPRVPVERQAELLREAAGDVPLIILWFAYSPYILPAWRQESRAVAALRSDAWTFIDLSAEFAASHKRGIDPRTFWNEIPFEGHLNRAGHRIVGTLLAAELAKLPPP